MSDSPTPPIGEPESDLRRNWPLRKPDVYFFDGLGDAWVAMSENLGLWVGKSLLLLFLLVAAFGGCLFMVVRMGFDATSPAVWQDPDQILRAWLFMLGPLLLGVFLQAGLVAATVRWLDGEEVGIGTMFRSFRRPVGVVGLTLLALSGYILLSLPFAVNQNPFDPRILLSASAFIVAYILFFYPFILAITRVALDDGDGLASLRLAYLMAWSPAHAAKALLLALILMVLGFGAMLPCFLGMPFFIPLASFVVALHYRDLFR